MDANEKRSESMKKYWANKVDKTSPFKGQTYEERYGVVKATKVKAILAAQKIGKNNPVYRDDVKAKISTTARQNFKNGTRLLPTNNTPHGGFRVDLGFYVRSGWELILLEF
jgi:hypothetical protein